MAQFDAMAYGPVLAELIQGDRLNDLGPGRSHEAVRERLQSLTVARAFAHADVVDESMANCCISGVWLLHDFLDESHTLSQGLGSAEGSYWHGIMHRREPDSSNSKHWFRRVGEHAIFERLAEEARALGGAVLGLGREWDAAAFIDTCERVRGADDDAERIAREIQRAEWELLFDHCYRRALGGR